MHPIIPFKIEITDEKLAQLQQKLAIANLPDELENAEWEYGAPLADMKSLTNHWKNGFDWRKQEAELNMLPQFKTKIEVDGFGILDMHFVHSKSDSAGAIPLLFCHGWPGSFIEVTKLLPLLNNGKDVPAFHVVAPSIPNFGFSSRITKKGFAIPQYAEAIHKIMLALGYNNYVTQGGDWGFMITRALAHLYPNHVMALHTNMCLAPFPSFISSPLLATTSLIKHAIGWYTPTEKAHLEQAISLSSGSGRGYFSLLSTKPQTISYSLSDSPIGLLAFIYEKLIAWTDDYPWTDDEILTWISIYYFSTAGPAASGFIYYEFLNDKKWNLARLQSYVDKPLGFTYFPKELANLPRDWLRGMGRVVWVGDAEKGGHFATWEQPVKIVEELRGMFGRGGPAFGVVEGKSGY